jgi:uncharacterized protein YigE (DUF2233 family)
VPAFHRLFVILALLAASNLPLNQALAEPRQETAIAEPANPTAPAETPVVGPSSEPVAPIAPSNPTVPAASQAPVSPAASPAPSSPAPATPVHQEEPAIPAQVVPAAPSPTVPATPSKPTPVIAPKPITKPSLKPVKPIRTPAQPAAKPIRKPVAKPVVPAKKPQVKPLAKPAAKPRVAPIKKPRLSTRITARLGVTPSSRPGPMPAPTPSITLETRRVAGITVRVVRVNLGDPRVKLRVIAPMAGIGRGGANFNTLVNGSNAVAVINGGYFHPRTFSIAGDLVVDGRHISTGRLRSVFAITPDNRVVIRTHSSINAAAWGGYETALAGGPFVLQKGNVVVAPRREGYRDPSVWGKAPRSAVGVVNDRQFFFISTTARLNLFDLAKVMDALGAKDAIALDGGSSVGMAFRREVLIRPNRRIAYGLGVFVEPKPIKRTKL